MRENLQDIYKVLTTDETLLRLLYYKPLNANDSPLSPTKDNVLDMSEKWDIILDVIKTTDTTNELDGVAKCRICFYPGGRSRTNNYLYANQGIVFDIYTHFTFDNVDLRNSWICDTINELLSNKKVTGMGKIVFEGGNKIKSPLDGYSAYRLAYSFGSGN